MRLVVLGSGTSVFHPRRASAGFWLQTKAASILLDCSADAPHRMAEEGIDWPNLDAIWISHLHLDHCAGLAPFLFGMKWARESAARRKPLKLFGCEGIEKLLKATDEVHHYKLFEQPFAVEIYEIHGRREDTPFELFPELRTQTISTPHCAESLAVRFRDSDGASMVYTSDTGYSDSIAQFARDVDLLILDCSFYRHKPTPKHLELAEAIRIAQDAKPKQLMLTHLYPEWDAFDLETEAKKLWSGETIAARDGLRLQIGS